MAPISDIRRITVTIRNPTGADDPGLVAEGFYIIDRDELVMTDKSGRPITNEAGNEWRARLPAEPELERRI